MSTVAIGAIINECVREMPENACYLNIGTWYGYSLFAGMAGNSGKRCIGVDSFQQFGQPQVAFRRRFEKQRSDRSVFYEMDWRRYMHEIHREKIGVLFYDASHDEENQYASLVCCDPFIIDGGIVLIDDTNWTGPRDGTRHFLDEHPNYKIIFSIATPWNCHPTFWNGLMILRKEARRE